MRMEDKKKNSPKTLLIIFGLVSSLLLAIMIIGWIMAAGRS